MRWVQSLGWLIAAMLTFAQASYAGTEIPKVVVSVAPLKPYVDEILKGITTAQSLTRPGQDPHNFTLAPSQGKMLDEVEILIIPDHGLSPLLARLMKARPKVRIIELSTLAGADALPYAPENPWIARVKLKGGEADDLFAAAPTHKFKPYKSITGKLDAKPAVTPDATAAIDPHFWLDPERMAALAEPVAEAIAQFAPTQREVLTANARTLAKHLRSDVIPPLQAMLKPSAGDDIVVTKPEIPFITYHAAYQYFLARFHIVPEGEITARPDEYLGAKTLDQLLQAAKATKIRCIIGEQDTPMVRRIAALSQARIVLLSPEQLVVGEDIPTYYWIQNDYDRLLYLTAKRFSECL
ncbi:MAG: metal ABC transporter solute-binding protein, Zn/Mn family [Rickettsiales bacterium]